MKNLATYVFTTKDIVNHKTPILRVVYDDDGDWQFLSNENILNEDDAMLVSLDEMLLIDESLEEVVSQIHKGGTAYRNDYNSPWLLL